MEDDTYSPSIGDVVLVDSRDRRVRGTWIVVSKTENGNYDITRYKDNKAMNNATMNKTVKPIWLENMVGAVIATIKPEQIESYA